MLKGEEEPMLEPLISYLFGISTYFIVLIIGILIASILDIAIPNGQKWTRFSLFAIAVLFTITPAIEAIRNMKDFASNMISLFMSVYPVLTAGLFMNGGTLAFSIWNPALFFFIQFSVFLSEKLLIPLLITTILLDFVSRFHPSTSFTKLSDLIRTSLLSIVSAIVVSYSFFISIQGFISWNISSAFSEPVKKLIQQNIPFVGSFFSESLSTFSRFSSSITAVTGSGLAVGILVIVLVPTIKTILIAFCYRFVAAFIEPFAPEDLADFLDDIGKSLFVLSMISFLIAFAFFYTAIFVVIILKLSMLVRG